MDVVRMDRFKRLGDLEHGQRFRKQDDPQGPVVWQVSCNVPRTGMVFVTGDKTGRQTDFRDDTMVEVVEGRWVPEEEADTMPVSELSSDDVFEYQGDLWQRSKYSCDNSQRLRDGEREGIGSDTRVRVVRGTFVEEGAEHPPAGQEGEA